MTLVKWKPATSLARSFDSIFDDFFGNTWLDRSDYSYWNPAVDVIEEEKKYVVNMDLPGLTKDDVKITVENDTLRISGEKKHENEEKKKNYHRCERYYGKFERSFNLGTEINNEKIEANFKDGVLHINLPKSESAKPKTIDVNVK
jgi:HSP20 family protein